MEQLAQPIRQLLALPRMFRGKTAAEGPTVRMSEIDRSLIDSVENIKTEHPAPETLRRELDELDFRRFVADLSPNRIAYERTGRKETIVVDSLPDRDAADVRVVKVRITVPKEREAGCTSTFKREGAHHLPIMGRAALMSRRRQGANNDSAIVEALVTQRFRDCLLSCHEKSFQRRVRCRRDDLCEISSIASEATPSSTHSVDMKFLLSTDALNVETTNESTTLEETLEYDATQFLQDALGDELNNYYSTDASYMYSIGTSNVSALVSKADTQEESNIAEYDYYPFDKRVGELLTASNVQYQIMLQTSKALGFCRSTKAFSAGAEELAAERILLLATCKRDAIRAEIHRLEYEEAASDAPPASFGRLRVGQIVLPPQRTFAAWYVCVLSHGAAVRATEAARADADGCVRLRAELAFERLRPDFAVRVVLYALRPQDDATTLCPLSPRRRRKPRDGGETSSYRMCGEFTLRVGDVGRGRRFKMAQLDGDCVLDFDVGVSVREACSGFLDVGLVSGETIAWNRRWCTLRDAALRYHNCPGEEDALGAIDLHRCATAAIASADRRICARPRTLLVEVFGDGDDAIVQYFLAADSKQYMEMWADKLNATVDALSTWNALQCAPARRVDFAPN